MTTAFVWDIDTGQERMTDGTETVQILQEIFQQVVKDDRSLIYSHKVCSNFLLLFENMPGEVIVKI